MSDWVRDAKRLAKRDGVQAALVAMSRALECVEAADHMMRVVDLNEHDEECQHKSWPTTECDCERNAADAYRKARGEG